MTAEIRRAVAFGSDASVNLHRQARVDGIDQVTDVVFDVGGLQVFPPEIAGIDYRQKIIQDLNDGRLVGQRRRRQVFELRLQLAVRVEQFQRNGSHLIP